MRPAALVLLGLALLAPSLVAARHTFASIQHDDRAIILVAQPFGFGEDGRMNITVTNYNLEKPGKTKGNPHK